MLKRKKIVLGIALLSIMILSIDDSALAADYDTGALTKNGSTLCSTESTNHKDDIYEKEKN